jgi:hypothetical protein
VQFHTILLCLIPWDLHGSFSFGLKERFSVQFICYSPSFKLGTVNLDYLPPKLKSRPSFKQLSSFMTDRSSSNFGNNKLTGLDLAVTLGTTN